MHPRYCGGHDSSKGYSKEFLKNCKLIGLKQNYSGTFMFSDGPVLYCFDLSACGEGIKDIVYSITKQLHDRVKEETKQDFRNRFQDML